MPASDGARSTASSSDGSAANANAAAAIDGAAAARATSRSPRDFLFVRSIGEGSFSTVYAGVEIATGKQCAIKVCEKQVIVREGKSEYVKRERSVMMALNENPSPLVVRLFCTFQDEKHLYFVMTLAENGELLNWMHKLGSFDESVSRFYAAEILLALEHLHSLGIIHRDVKPENILLSASMHVMLSDFGSAKILNPGIIPGRPTPLLPTVSRKASFVGTAQYVSPEVLNGTEATPCCDYWALGCILYQMLSGLPPFRAANEYLIFQKIIKGDYSFPVGFNETAGQLVSQLLTLEPTERLGAQQLGGAAAVKAHPFFADINWRTLCTETPPQMVPYLPGVSDSSSNDFFTNVHEIEPGFDDRQLSRLLGLSLGTHSKSNGTVKEDGQVAVDLKTAMAKKLDEQRRSNPYHRFVDNHLIIKSGFLEKRKGLFARKRMFLLTEGPRMFYVDPFNMELKGQIPWTADLMVEAKNFKIFFVHTPNRTYYLEDLSGHALEWCRVIEQVHQKYFSRSN